MSDDTNLSVVQATAAEARAADARARLSTTLARLQARLSPKALALDAARHVLEKSQSAARTGVDTAKKHPVTVAGALTAVGLFFARRPIARLLSRPKHATPADVASLKPERALPAPKRKPQ